jgi:hypothetical protein
MATGWTRLIWGVGEKMIDLRLAVKANLGKCADPGWVPLEEPKLVSEMLIALDFYRW